MNEIKCPKCGEIFSVDESSYAQILEEIKNKEFEKELNLKISEFQKNSEEKEKLKLESLKLQVAEVYKNEIANLKESIAETALKDSEAFSEYENKIAELKTKISENDSKIKVAVLEEKNNNITLLNEKDSKIKELQNELALKDKEKTIDLTSLKEQYESKLKDKDSQIEYYKDLKIKLSTKLVGETLEQHCQILFNQIRPTAFPNAYFEKDNKVSNESSSKGDFIFRDYSDGQEYVSIMFEMKNENDTTATKHKNEDFFKELDKDRNEKGCEYAILVSMLEPDNEFYNAGIVDVSYKYPKMYVVRPQCFISIITLLANAAKNSISYQRQLAEVKSQNIDITNFEEKLFDFQSSFSKNFESASTHFENTLNAIDDAIKKLNKIKEELTTTGNQLRLANNKAQELSIKKLTYGNKTMQDMFKK